MSDDTQSQIVVLTYDASHRKTEDVVWKLVSSGYRNLHLVAIPWIERKERRFIYPHRPGEKGWPSEASFTTSVLALNFGFPFSRCDTSSLGEVLKGIDPTLIVVGGAQLLPEVVVDSWKVLNVHPGLLPVCRGLDILKWSIIESLQVGVTAHLCDGRADLGRRISEAIVPVYPWDTFHSFAMRQYEMENDLIPWAVSEALVRVKSEFQEIPETFSMGAAEVTSESRRRMPRRIEAGLLPAFEKYKLVYARS